MKINVEFANLEETVEFADFIKGRTTPAETPVPMAEAVQNTAPTPTAPSAAQAGQGMVTQQPFTGVQPPVQQTAPGAAAQPQQTAQAGGVPTAAAPAYTINDLIAAIQPIDDAGGRPQLQALLQSFGVTVLNDLPQEMYGAFATALRGIGAQI